MVKRSIQSEIETMRREVPPEFDVASAKEWLSTQYKAPLKIISAWEKSGQLIRLKRGLYVFADRINQLAAAGSLHGPSYISFETALAFYNLIPERVEVILSVVDGRPLSVQTPIGLYEYYSQARDLFAQGMGMQIQAGRSFLIATKEKAVLDSLARAQLQTKHLSDAAVLDFVTDGLRVEIDELRKMSLRSFARLAPKFRNHAPRKMVAALSKRMSKRRK